MKKALLAGAVMMLGAVAFAAPRVSEQSVTDVGTATAVSISTSAWTKVPASSSLTSRTQIRIGLAAGLNAGMGGILGDCDTSPSEAITVTPRVYAKGASYVVEVYQDVCLYLVSLHTAAENADVQEEKK